MGAVGTKTQTVTIPEGVYVISVACTAFTVQGGVNQTSVACNGVGINSAAGSTNGQRSTVYCGVTPGKSYSFSISCNVMYNGVGATIISYSESTNEMTPTINLDDL